MSHWHLSLGENDENSGTALDVPGILDSLATEFDRSADYQHDVLVASGESGNYEQVWRSYQKIEELATHSANARTLYTNHTCPREERAPLYRESDDENENQRKLGIATDHFLNTIISDEPGPICIWECDKKCPLRGDDD